MKKNLKTTVLGIVTILTAIGTAIKAMVDNDPLTNMDVGATMAAITAGLGLIVAKDANSNPDA